MIFFYELKKLACSSLMLGLVLLSIGVNAVISLTSYHPPDTDARTDMNPANIFENYYASELAEGYIRKYGIEGIGASLLRDKYDQLQQTVDEKAVNGDALSVYFGEDTPYLHGLLFKTLFQAILAEVSLLSLLGALLSTTYEQMRRTDSLVYVSKTGRRIQLAKLFASLTASAASSVLVITASLTIFFVRFDFSQVWSANVSSAFNRAVNEFKPLLTWNSFTVSEYLAASIGISVLLAFAFCLLGYAAGIGFRQAYAAFGAVVSAVACMFLLVFIFPVGSLPRGLWSLNPVWLWKNSGLWFTDGDANLLWPHFEKWSLGVSAAGLACCAGLAFVALKRREWH